MLITAAFAGIRQLTVFSRLYFIHFGARLNFVDWYLMGYRMKKYL
jgi:hypothetical protein